MSDTNEVQHSIYQIEKTVARLEYQRNVVSRLGLSRDPGFAALESETLASLEERLEKLLFNHKSLLVEQGVQDD